MEEVVRLVERGAKDVEELYVPPPLFPPRANEPTREDELEREMSRVGLGLQGEEEMGEEEEGGEVDEDAAR